MTEEKQRIALARLCGANCWYRDTTIGPELVVEMYGPAPMWKRYVNQRYGEELSTHFLPDFLNDLNAIAQTASVLTLHQQTIFERELIEITDSTRFLLINATAAQRAKAILLAAGLWEGAR